LSKIQVFSAFWWRQRRRERLYNKHTCREVSPGLDAPRVAGKFPELTERSEVGSGNFQPPEVRPIPDSPNLQVCLVFITCHFGKNTKEFTHFSIQFLVWIMNILASNILRKQTNKQT
jgi:hypothetical protein